MTTRTLGMTNSSEKLVTTSIFGFGQTREQGYLTLRLFWSVRPYPEYVFEKVALYFTDGEALQNVDLINEKDVVVPERFLEKKIKDVEVIMDINNSRKPVISNI